MKNDYWEECEQCKGTGCFKCLCRGGYSALKKGK
jgi:hypothetical protein